MRWRKSRAVATFEFLSTVRSKGWIIMTFGMPVFLLLYGGLVSFVGIVTEMGREKKVAVYGVVDDAGLLGLAGDVEAPRAEVPDDVREALEASGQASVLDHPSMVLRNHVFRPYPTEESAREALIAKEVKAYFRVPADYVRTGALERYCSTSETGMKESGQSLSKLLLAKLLEGRLPSDVEARVEKPVAEWKELTITREGEVRPGGAAARVIGLLLPVAFAVLLLMAILSSAGGLVQATSIEKENRVVEVLLASAAPDEILLGKLLGAGAAGILQVAVWFGMIVVSGLSFASTLASLGVEIPWGAAAAAVIFFVVAYLFFGSLMLGSGSIGSTQREGQQWAMIWTLLAAVPMIFLAVIIEEPHGVAARLLTWIPFSTATTVVFRLAIDPSGIAWWEVVGPLVLLLGTTWVAIRLGARLFRVGILLTGSRPGLRAILRQARLQG